MWWIEESGRGGSRYLLVDEGRGSAVGDLVVEAC